jgi:hypothetical protein
MAKTPWKMVRIRESTHARLCQVIASLRRAADQGQYEARNRHLVDITLDDAINVLIDRDNAKRERAKKSRKARNQDNVHNVDTSPAVEG